MALAPSPRSAGGRRKRATRRACRSLGLLGTWEAGCLVSLWFACFPVPVASFILWAGDRAGAQERAKLLQEVQGIPCQAQVHRGDIRPLARARAQAEVQAGTDRAVLRALALPANAALSTRR